MLERSSTKGCMQLVLHAPWQQSQGVDTGAPQTVLPQFNFEPSAAATEYALLLSLAPALVPLFRTSSVISTGDDAESRAALLDARS